MFSNFYIISFREILIFRKQNSKAEQKQWLKSLITSLKMENQRLIDFNRCLQLPESFFFTSYSHIETLSHLGDMKPHTYCFRLTVSLQWGSVPSKIKHFSNSQTCDVKLFDHKIAKRSGLILFPCSKWTMWNLGFEYFTGCKHHKTQRSLERSWCCIMLQYASRTGCKSKATWSYLISVCPLKMIKRTISAIKGLIYKTLTQYNQIKLRSFSKAFKQLILRPVQM